MIFNNIPIRVFYKRLIDGEQIVCNRNDFINEFHRVGKFRFKVYKYDEEKGRIELERKYIGVDEIDSMHNFVSNKFKQYTREKGIVLDMELSVFN